MKLFSFLPVPAGAALALIAALLFGASTPVAKVLVGKVDPILLAGLLYFGSGSGLAVWWWLRSRFQRREPQEASLQLPDLPWLAGAILAGGVVGPVLLMIGLALTPASSASLLLNLEGVFTTTFSWFVFQEHVDRRLVLGMASITLGGLLLSWEGQPELGRSWGMAAIVGACLAWGIDNNLTRKISAGDPLQIAGLKGLIAGLVNLLLAHAVGVSCPSFFTIVAAVAMGFLGYGVSLVLFVVALRHIGTARTGAYFSVAPFFGVMISLLALGESLTVSFLSAAVLMGLGVWLHLTERHAHEHKHEPLEHEHRHVHDAHHRHDYREEPHSHPHSHVELLHNHSHYPDIHHRHGH